MQYLHKTIDLHGKYIGQWFVIYFCGSKGGRSKWRCICKCGTEKTVLAASLLNKTSKSCGCLTIKLAKISNTKHGLRQSKIYPIWGAMIQRCCNPKNPNYKHYGGRGIKVCNQWKKFENFFNDVGHKPEGKTLERINNNKGYNKRNCKWATWKEQANNKRRPGDLKYITN